VSWRTSAGRCAWLWWEEGGDEGLSDPFAEPLGCPSAPDDEELKEEDVPFVVELRDGGPGVLVRR